MSKTKKTAPAPSPPVGKRHISYFVPIALAEQVRDIAYYDRCSVNSLVIEALRALVAKREKARGGPYPRREKPLHRGQ